MNITNMVLIAVIAVFTVLYVLRRRARLNRELND
jgi:hypothetical protein